MATSIHAHSICSLEHSLRTSCKPATGYASTTRGIHHMVSAKTVHRSQDPCTSLYRSSHHCSVHKIFTSDSLLLSILPSMILHFHLGISTAEDAMRATNVYLIQDSNSNLRGAGAK